MALVLNLATPVRTLVLIGGGEFSFGDTREIDLMLLARMPEDRRTIAFLPTASGSAEYAVHLGKYFQQLDPGVTLVNVPVYRGRDSRRPKNVETILSAGMVYVGGGVTNTFLETVRESPAETAMREAAARGAVIAAIGAAASCFGTFARDMRGTGALAGMGWLTKTTVETGFDPQNDVTLRRLMSLPQVEVGLGIPSKSALLIGDSGEAEILGDGKVATFRKK